LDELVIQSRRVVANGTTQPAAVVIENGRIASLIPYISSPRNAETLDYGDSVIMAGLVDSHVHVNEPGRTEWEGFETATDAAAAGGVTTIVDMPLNCIPVTTSAAALREKLAAVDGRLRVDAAFWGGVVPGNAGELEGLAAAGARGCKAFMCHSGIDDFPQATEEDLRRAMPVLARLGLPLLLHAELCLASPGVSGDAKAYDSYLRSRPARWEVDAIALAARLCEETRCRTHIVHLSAAEALPIVEKAKKAGLPFSAETCPHYLTFAAEEIEPGHTEYKCAPPIRERANREKLWAALRSGVLDMIVSDHSPCLPELKKRQAGDFAQAWGGISGLQFTLPAAWTGLSARGGTLAELSRLVSEAPARLAGLERKGRLAPGLDADVAVWDPEAEFEVRPELVRHRHKLTPYSGRALSGRTRAVFLRGRKIFEDGPVGERAGRPLVPTEARWTSPN